MLTTRTAAEEEEEEEEDSISAAFCRIVFMGPAGSVVFPPSSPRSSRLPEGPLLITVTGDDAPSIACCTSDRERDRVRGRG